MTDFFTDLLETVNALMQPGKGILAIDESHGTCQKRFEALGIPFTEAMRQEYRGLLVSSPQIEDAVSGMILFDETLRQNHANGKKMVDILKEKNILAGIKVDKGAKQLAMSPEEKVTEGLDGLRDRLAEYKTLGARFAKWRAVITIKDGLPSMGCLEANTHALARYAALCQEQGIVPMVEPEVLIEGDHSIEACFAVTEQTLKMLFQQLFSQNVMLEGVVLKTSMVIAGKNAAEQASPEEVAGATLECLYNACPPALGGIVFLSGGQTEAQSTQHLNLINQMGAHPWGISFSYGRAIQAPCLKAWNGKKKNIEKAQKALLKRASMNRLAEMGQWTPEAETAFENDAPAAA